MAASAWLRNVHVEMCKNQTRETILDDVTLTVPEKSIIGLIGPSGCGKTSLIRTLIGILPKKSGEIFVGGYQNDNIRDLPPPFLGYMPQGDGLNEMLKGIDLLRFAGRVFNIKQSEINRRIETLRGKIDLPQDLGYIHLMNGGQKHRLSLALAIIHRPKLLLLDEPTVGSDPVSRVKIWKYLEECRDQYGMTIIITTHYVEEVNRADSVAFMYRGHILCHDKPYNILESCGVHSLEEAARVNYQQYRQVKEINGDYQPVEDKYERLPPIEPYTTQPISQFRILWASTIRISKEWRFNLLSAIFLSAWFCFLIFAIVNYLWRSPRKIPVCLLETEEAELTSSKVLQEFIHKLNDSILLDIKRCTSLEISSTLEISNFITIGTGYETNLYRISSHFEHNDEISPLLYYYGDSSNIIETQLIQNFLENSLIDEIAVRSSKNSSTQSHWLQILRIEPIDGRAVEDNDRRAYSHLLSMYFIFFNYMYGQVFGSFNLAFERMGDFTERQRIMGIKPGPLLLAHFIRVNTQQILIFDVAGLILCLVCGFELNIIILKFLVASHFLAACGFCVGCLMAAKFSSVFTLLFIIYLYNCSQIWLNNLIWSTASLPYFMQPLTLTFPYQQIMESMQRILMGLEGGGIGQFLVPGIWILLSSILACYFLK